MLIKSGYIIDPLNTLKIGCSLKKEITPFWKIFLFLIMDIKKLKQYWVMEHVYVVIIWIG